MRIGLLALLLLGCSTSSAPSPRPPVGVGEPRRDEATHRTKPTPPRPPSENRHPCDPLSTSEPAPTPADAPRATCGNGVLEEQVVGVCQNRCFGGCDGPLQCTVECPRATEQCDGAALGLTCEAADYAGGAMRCTSSCKLDDTGCKACIPGPGVRCGTWSAGGDETFVISGKGAAAVITRDDTKAGRLRGAALTAALGTKPLGGLPATTLAASVVDGGLGFVDAKRRFGVVDPTGRVRMRGPIGDDVGGRVLIYRETDQPDGVAVLAGDYQQLTLAVFSTSPLPRHFSLSNYRIVMLPGDDVLIVHGNDVRAYHLTGMKLTPLAQVPTGASFSYAHPTFTDTVGGRTVSKSTDTMPPALPKGVGKLAVAGAGSAPAFGGTVYAKTDGGRTQLAWIAQP